MTRRIGLIAVAIILAAVGTFAVYSYAHNADKRAVDATRGAKVLIAQKAVPAGTTWSDVVKGNYLSVETIPANTAPSNALQSLDAAVPVDEVATAGIASGQVVIRPMFDTKAPQTGLIKVAKGNLAISVSLPANADVAGYVQNGSQVAIFVTSKLKEPSGAKVSSVPVGGGEDVYLTKLLLPRIDVVAVSQDAPRDVNGAKSDSNNNNSTNTVLVTLSVSQAQAQRIILAQQVGQLYLGLLSQDSVTSDGPGSINIVQDKPTPIFVNN